MQDCGSSATSVDVELKWQTILHLYSLYIRLKARKKYYVKSASFVDESSIARKFQYNTFQKMLLGGATYAVNWSQTYVVDEYVELPTGLCDE